MWGVARIPRNVEDFCKVMLGDDSGSEVMKGSTCTYPSLLQGAKKQKINRLEQLQGVGGKTEH